jgi:hypothetical protein
MRITDDTIASIDNLFRIGRDRCYGMLEFGQMGICVACNDNPGELQSEGCGKECNMATNPSSGGEFIPEPYPMSPEEKAAAMAKAKANFSAADLQRFTEEEEGIPMEEIIAELDELHRTTSLGGK